MFVIATVRAPFSRASRASIVSRVSPDCVIPMTRSCSLITGFR